MDSTQKTKELAYALAKSLKPGDVLALSGDLGAGKTTFTRYLAEALGFKARVQSPTFIIARKYERATGDIKRIHHLDLYRLTVLAEVLELGLQDFFADSEAISVIEWPEVAFEVLPTPHKRLHFEVVSDTERKIHVQDIN
ncbi:tRNA (adenosine(37)-N6)-threonylcarbamoyltransferase complex ATPase subunit type 1 TsaE [Patescibacteria group bacterium]|nr:tRNA (adenosine(37)-N6)-threonylcarbamoyltransferase complex ATPase subunit type 1 TsaE [Patescibacteria group bacterium]